MKSKSITFKNHVSKILLQLKQEQLSKAPPVIPIYYEKKLLAYLRVISISSYDSKEDIALLAKWRYTHEKWFPSQFKVTVDGTKKWLKEKLFEEEFRILFMIETPSGKPIGHLGLFRFDFSEQACEVDNVVRGEKDIPGIMTHAIRTLMEWAREYLDVTKFHLQVFSDNTRAIDLYKRCGFTKVRQVPLRETKDIDRVIWVEDTAYRGKVKRKNLYMTHA
jgi:RimJ/RimL family protein N-acetyltransferase